MVRDFESSVKILDMFASKYLLAVASMWACGAVGAAVPVEVGVEKRGM